MHDMAPTLEKFKISLPKLLLSLLFVLNICFGVKVPQRDATEPLKWWQEGIIYQIYPRSHMDSNGDGIGDLTGIESKLDHFVDIGITAIWICPIYKSPMKDFGYDISNFTDIEPIFGDMESFRSLSAALKARNIKLIMDMVPNHSSDEHPWFPDSVAKIEPYTDYYVWKDPKGFEDDGTPIPPSNWMSVFSGSMWEWRQERQQFYLHQFLAGQPDLNYENPAVLEEMLGVMKFWLDQGVDGFRVDAVPHMFEDSQLRDEPVDPDRPETSVPTDWNYYSHDYTFNLPQVLDVLAVFRELVDNYTASDGRERCMMVEVPLLELDELFTYYGTQDDPIAHFPFNFEFFNRIKQNFTANDVIALVDEYYEKMPVWGTANWLVGNHDNHRVATRYGDWVIDPFNMLIHLLPGASVTYYGEEIGMNNTYISWEDTVDPAGCNVGPERYELFSRDPERTPMQWDDTYNAGFSTGNETWLPLNENYVDTNVAVQRGIYESHLEIYKSISSIRKSDTWKYGSLETTPQNDVNIFGFSRIFEENGFLMLANFGDAEQTVDVRNLFERIPEFATVWVRSSGFLPEDTQIGNTLKTNEVTIGGKHSLILQFLAEPLRE